MINSDTDKLLTFTFENVPASFDQALSKIIKVTKTKNIVFGLEDTMSFGLHLSYYLTNFGFEVKQINPTTASGYRATLPNYHKSDEFDAFCIAKVLRDNYKQLPSFNHELLYSNMKLLVQLRSQYTKQQRVNYILLHQQLAKVYPGYSKFFSALKKRGALAFFKHFPSPRYLKGYSAETLRIEMKKYTTEFPIKKGELILTTVRSNPIPFIDIVVEGIIQEIINEIYSKEERMSAIDEQLKILLAQTEYKLESIPGISTVTAAKMISEIGNINRFKSHHHLAKYAGIAPNSVGSGGKNKELVSKGGNRELRATFYYCSLQMILVTRFGNNRNDYFRGYYLQKLAQGKTKVQAVICVMRKLIIVIFSLMKSQKEYVAPKVIDNKDNEEQIDF